jgi:hypothetical protein
VRIERHQAANQSVPVGKTRHLNPNSLTRTHEKNCTASALRSRRGRRGLLAGGSSNDNVQLKNGSAYFWNQMTTWLVCVPE